MLVDAAKHGDVEIPVFCYEPKLGEPVGACRMCLVEIEGIPKLQTACSTPVRDGMVVYTQTDQVKEAQNAVVEFLLVNHPLDCPVCDKGGECPLQDISMGWGPGRSRFTDPKRHFEKPLPLSPLVAIDRERCILCYRCVRFSQEVSEDEQLQLLERGDRRLRRHLRRAPLHRALPRQHHRALPGRRADQLHLPLPRPPLGHRAGRLGLHALPEPVQRRASRSATRRSSASSPATTPRSTTAGSATRAATASRCSAPRSGSPARWSAPGGNLTPVSWAEAIETAAAGPPRRRREDRGARRRRLQRGGLPRPAHRPRGARLGRHRLAPARRRRPRRPARPLAPRALGQDERHRRGRRDPRPRHRPAARRADPRPPDPQGDAPPRRRPRRRRRAPDRPRRRREPRPYRYAPGEAAGSRLEQIATAASSPRRRASPTSCGGKRTVIVWGERLGRRPRRAAATPCSSSPKRSASRPRAGLLEVPEAPTPAACARSAACPTPARASARPPPGRDADAIRDGARRAASSTALILFGADPLRDFRRLGRLEGRRSRPADFIVAFSMFDDESTKPADVVFPLESHAEKEGTVTHPDGRLQRVRPSADPPGDIRPAGRSSPSSPPPSATRPGIASAPDALAAVAEESASTPASPHEEIGGRGIRWQERDAAAGAAEARRRRTRASRASRAGTTASRRGPRRRRCASAPTATSGPARSPSSTRRCGS